MHSTREEIVASLHRLAQFHLCKAVTTATSPGFVSKPADQQKRLLDAVFGTGAELGYFSEATLEVYGMTLAKYLPGLLDQLDELDAACRAIGSPTNSYEHFRGSLL